MLHFEKGQLPPANAFWSPHVYNSQHGFAANPANAALRSTDGLKYNADGSLDVSSAATPASASARTG